MKPFPAARLAAWTGGTLAAGKADAVFRAVSTDSRACGPGDLFVPLRGRNFDAHRFIGQAVARGAAGYLCRPDWPERPGDGDAVRVEVADANEALADLAGHYRRQFSIPVAAVTGSAGKTTTRSLAAWALGGRFPVLSNPANFNNLFGLPLTLLSLEEKHRAAVLEMGMNRPGEIARLAEIARPAFVMITNTGSAHLGLLGCRAAIAAAKSEILARAPRAVALLPAGDRFLEFFRMFPARRRITFGLGRKADYRPLGAQFTERGTRFRLKRPAGRPLEIESPLAGRFNLLNLVAAAALAESMGLAEDTLVERMASFPAPAHRFQLRAGPAGSRLVDDTYNASPDAFRAALAEFSRLAGRGRRIIVCGSMGELGRFSPAAHLALGRQVGRCRPEILLVMGPERETLRRGARAAGLEGRRIASPADNDEAREMLRRRLEPGDWVLFKGSRFLRLEEIVDALAG